MVKKNYLCEKVSGDQNGLHFKVVNIPHQHRCNRREQPSNHIKKLELTLDWSKNVRGILIRVLGTIMCCVVLFAFWLMCFSCKVRRRRMQQFEDLKIDNLYHDELPIIINHERRRSESSTSTWTTYQKHQRNRFINREWIPV